MASSGFHSVAIQYAGDERVQHPVKPINGQGLAGLMIQYGVGVRARSTYTNCSLDEGGLLSET